MTPDSFAMGPFSQVLRRPMWSWGAPPSWRPLSDTRTMNWWSSNQLWFVRTESTPPEAAPRHHRRGQAIGRLACSSQALGAAHLTNCGDRDLPNCLGDGTQGLSGDHTTAGVDRSSRLCDWAGLQACPVSMVLRMSQRAWPANAPPNCSAVTMSWPPGRVLSLVNAPVPPLRVDPQVPIEETVGCDAQEGGSIAPSRRSACGPERRRSPRGT
jgi:hypothetical protein